jgi:hypothetical protein
MTMNRNDAGYFGAAVLFVVGILLIAFAIASLIMTQAPEPEPTHDTLVAEAAYTEAVHAALMEMRGPAVFTRIQFGLAERHGSVPIQQAMDMPSFKTNLVLILVGSRVFETLAPAESQREEHERLVATMQMCADGVRTADEAIATRNEDLFTLAGTVMMPCLDRIVNEEE